MPYDLAFGGAFYAYVEAGVVGLELTPENFRLIFEAGSAIKKAIVANGEAAHPFEDDLGFLYGVIFTGPAHSTDGHSRHVCVFADGEVDRSPTGTGVSGRLAILHVRGEIGAGPSIAIESLLGTRLIGRVVEPTAYGPYPAVIPEIRRLGPHHRPPRVPPRSRGRAPSRLPVALR